VGGTGEIAVTVSKFGFLPNPHRPTAFVAGVQTGPELENLAVAIGRVLAPLGCPSESRPYKPHVTLARIKASDGKSGGEIQKLREHIAGMADFDFGNFHASQFHLYRSTPGPRNSEYSILASYDLMRERIV
jgi:2'-5' RNA ligase